MALFPAYAQDVDTEISDEGRASEPHEVSPGHETQLLASDSGTDDERYARPTPPARPATSHQSSHDEPFYWDTKLDCGNLRVSTLYYPGRPEYALSAKPWSRAGGARGAGGAGAPVRYYHAPARDPPAHHELHARRAAYRRMLHDSPADHRLWLRYIDFQEQWFDGEAALRAAEEAAAALPGEGDGEGAGARAVRAELQRLRAAHLPRDALLQLLREELVAPVRDAEDSLRRWARLAAALGAAGTRSPPLCAAALPRLAQLPTAYPQLLYIHGATLRAAGMWEQLVLMIELVTAMNFPPAGFPPPYDEARERSIEENLLATEDKALRSGLPLSAVWVRVERARAAAHWRGAGAAGRAGGAGGAGGAADAWARDADPQRYPLPADVADLLLPVADDDAAFLLCVNLLRLAKVPLMPHAEYVWRAVGPAGLAEEEVGGAWSFGDAEVLLALLRAARRLPPAHPARAPPHLASALLAQFIDPPHYFTDETGFLEWVSSLWEACCAWTTGARRVALLCWRLRWLQALLGALDGRGAGARGEARRVRAEARAAIKRHAGDSPLPFAQFARLELAAGAAEGPAGAAAAGERAAHVAERALRAALADEHCAAVDRLYVARVWREVCGGGAAWALPCAALGRALPGAAELRRAPRPDRRLLDAALQHCWERCSELEARFEAGGAGGAAAALLPGAGEWGAARAALAPPAARARLRAALHARCRERPPSGEAARYYEQSACALLTAPASPAAARAPSLAQLFPHNALLAAAEAGVPLWRRAAGAGAGDGGGEEWGRGGARSHTGALAAVLPALLRAAADWAPREAERLRGACGRAARRGRGGGALAALALEAGARGERPGAAALLHALDRHADHKWLYVRGAAWVAREAATLADALLERQLRVHALRDELLPQT